MLDIQASRSNMCHIYNRKKKETEINEAESSKTKKYEY